MEKIKNRLSTTTYILLGLLCLVPLIGAMAGVALIIVGISKKTDKVLILLGAGGIAFSVAVYGSLFYWGFKTKAFDKGFETISVQFLNTKIKEVEFYKLATGEYPDSLAQLKLVDSLSAWGSFDPSKGQGMKWTEHKEFYYSKQDSGYYLFSTGYDNKPFTNDDIYPAFDGNILTKTGLKLDKMPATSH